MLIGEQRACGATAGWAERSPYGIMDLCLQRRLHPFVGTKRVEQRSTTMGGDDRRPFAHPFTASETRRGLPNGCDLLCTSERVIP